MVDTSDETGVTTAILRRLETQHIPRLLDIKAKVDRGTKLDDLDIEYLERVFADATSTAGIVEKHPELAPSVVRMDHLYKEITEKAMENEHDA